MKLLKNKERNGWNFLLLSKDRIELAWLSLELSGLQLEVEFPSDWHEHRRGWFKLGFGFCRGAISFPWPWTVEDHYQCSGPRFGFQFYSDLLWIRWGKDKGQRGDPHKAFYMPWSWKHREHKILTEPESHPYTYTLRSGKVQNRVATIKAESRRWTRFWLPYKMVHQSIDIEFNDEVGERSGSWKGGCIGCSYDMLPGEAPLDTLRRMERERKF